MGYAGSVGGSFARSSVDLKVITFGVLHKKTRRGGGSLGERAVPEGCSYKMAKKALLRSHKIADRFGSMAGVRWRASCVGSTCVA